MGFNNKRRATCYLFLGKISSALKHYPQAYAYYLKAEAIFDRIEGINNMYSLNCLINMAQIKHYSKELGLSFELYERALHMYRSKFGDTHLYIYVIYLNLVYLGYLLNLHEKKEFYYSELIKNCCSQVFLKYFN